MDFSENMDSVVFVAKYDMSAGIVHEKCGEKGCCKCLKKAQDSLIHKPEPKTIPPIIKNTTTKKPKTATKKPKKSTKPKKSKKNKKSKKSKRPKLPKMPRVTG